MLVEVRAAVAAVAVAVGRPRRAAAHPVVRLHAAGIAARHAAAEPAAARLRKGGGRAAGRGVDVSARGFAS